MSQPTRRRRGRIAIGLALATALAGAAVSTTPLLAAADPTPTAATADSNGGLDKHDADLLNAAQAAGKETVTVLVAAKDGQSSRAAQEIAQTGAKVEVQKDSVDYVRAEVPIDKVKTVAALGSVTALDVDETFSASDPAPDAQEAPQPQTAPSASTARVNPYMPTGDTGAAQFVNSHPTWDGRNVTVGIIDSGVDLGHPSLNTTSTGERKITDWVTYTDPSFTPAGVNTDNDPTWVLMSTPVAGSAVGLPDAGANLRYGVFNERDPLLGGEFGNDVNRDGNPAGSEGKFGVLWDPDTDTVWVDTNQNRTFADDQAMKPYKINHDVGVFGTDNPATPIRESMPFVVQTDHTNNSVNIGVVSSEHGSHVAGIVAGNSLFGGQMSGAAPGAKLVSVRVCLFVAGCTSHALLEGMIYAVTVAHVDVINMSIGGLPALNDGNNARAVLYNRLIEENGVQMFISAGNDGAGVNTLGDPAVVEKVVAVGSYISKATWKADYGSIARLTDNLHPFSSRGPREDGGFKPTIVAPGAAVSTTPTWMPGVPVAGTYDLPPGYQMLQGTSMASPQAAGVGALLVSAAKAQNVNHTPAQIREALTSSARFLAHFGAYEQGNGLIDVNQAWNLMKYNALNPVDITSSVDVHSLLSGFLATPGKGVGIYDREGVKPGDHYTRTYTFTRTSGPDTPVTYNVIWDGNTGNDHEYDNADTYDNLPVFSSASSVTLPRNTPVQFTVTIDPRKAGVHSAILNLDNPSTSGNDFQTLNTVIAAEDFTSAGGFAVTHSGLMPRNTYTSYFFRVGPGTPAFKVDLAGGGTTPGAGQIRFIRNHPYGTHLEDQSSLSCYNPPVTGGAGCALGDPTSRTVSNPIAGVWEVVVEARRTSDATWAPYTLTASVLGASVSPNPATIASATLGSPSTVPLSMTNQFGTFTGAAKGTALSSARLLTPSIAAAGPQQQYVMQVPAGTQQLVAQIGGASDLGADLDLYLFRCAPSCVQVGSSAGSTAEEKVTVNNPAAATWVALVVPFAVPAGTTTFKYKDMFVSPSYGSISVADANASRPSGSTWSANASVTATAAPGSNRVLLGNVEVRTDINVLVGSGDVIVQSVS